MHMVNTGAVGYMIQLYQIAQPWWCCPCASSLSKYIQSGKADTKLRLAKLFPADDRRQLSDGVEAVGTDDYNNDRHVGRRKSLQLGIDAAERVGRIPLMKNDELAAAVAQSSSRDDDDEGEDDFSSESDYDNDCKSDSDNWSTNDGSR